jgi:hypothetical protein
MPRVKRRKEPLGLETDQYFLQASQTRCSHSPFFRASLADLSKTPVQKWETSHIERVSVEKNKHVHIDIAGPTPINLHFTTGSRDLTSEIVDKLEVSRALAAGNKESHKEKDEASEPTRFIPPIRSDTPKSVHFSPASPSIIPAREEDSEGEEEHGNDIVNAVALYDFDADGDDELSVKEGEELLIIEKDGDEWWKCRNSLGKEGVVPASYLEVSSISMFRLHPLIRDQAKDPTGDSKQDSLAAQRAEEERLERERVEKEKKERAEKEKLRKEKERAERERAEKEHKRAEAESRAKAAAESAEAERLRRKEQAAKQQQHRPSPR